MSPETMLALLQTAACEIEEESDVSSNLQNNKIKFFDIFSTIFMILETSRKVFNW